MTGQYGKYERTFRLSVPRERAWRAFTDPKDLEAWLGGPVEECDIRPGGRIVFGGDEYSLVWEVIDADPQHRLVYREGAGVLPNETEVSVTFEERDSGTEISITQSGFGDGADWPEQLDSAGLGWVQTLAALDLYLRTGVRFDRFFTFKSDLGVEIRELLAGPEVVSVVPGSFAAQAGVEPGDILLQISAAPIFSRTDLWLFTREHPAGEECAVTYVRGSELRTGRGTLTSPAYSAG